MNYIELINQFWQTRRRVQFSAVETDLYFFLLQESNIRKWENPFECTNGLICASIGISEKTLIDVRNRLQTKGLISFVGGQKKKKSPVYTLLYCKNESITVSNEVSKTVSKTVSKNPNINININKTETKEENIEIKEEVKPPLNFPFSSDLFLKKWDLLTSSPVWSKKAPESLQLSLNTLSEYPEPFVLEMMNYAIESEWSMFKGIEMKRYFLEWQKQQKPEKQKPEKITRFKPPTLAEVTAYCKERKNSVNPQNFIDFYTSKGWMVGKSKMKDWQACVRTWEQSEKETKAPKVATKPEVLKASEDYGAKIQKQIAESKQRTAEIEAKRKQAKPLINIETIPEQILEKKISPEELAEIRKNLQKL